MKDSTPRIAGAGICCLDHIVVSPQVRWGGTAYVSDYCVQGGGLVATAIVACARLGADCCFYSLLGDDAVADSVEEGLRVEGVPTAGVVRVRGGASPFSFVHVDEHSGERTIFHRSGRDLRCDPETVDLSPIASCGALLIDDCYPDLSMAAAQAAREHGVPVVADIVPHARKRDLLSLVDVLIAPAGFAREASPDGNLDAALDAIHGYGPVTALVTLGSEGWVYSEPGGRGRGDAYQVEVVDTTGAGDTFHGAFAYGLARGWDTVKCGDFAAAVAAIKCTKPGGRTGLPSLAEALEFLEKRSSLEWSAES